MLFAGGKKGDVSINITLSTCVSKHWTRTKILSSYCGSYSDFWAHFWLAQGRWGWSVCPERGGLKWYSELIARTKLCSLIFSLNICHYMGTSWHSRSSAFPLMRPQALLCPLCSLSFFILCLYKQGSAPLVCRIKPLKLAGNICKV